MRTNYSGEKRRKELAAKQKKEAKAAKAAERKALKAQYPDGIPPELAEEEAESEEE
jgi:hypothetical protein